MKILFYIAISVIAVFVLFMLHFLFTALTVKPERPERNEKYLHYAFLIPARNEEKVIGELLRSIDKLDYPKDLYDVYVAINGCTDKTEEIALSNNARILDCDTKARTKGAVLEKIFGILKDHKEIDAYVIFDADSMPGKDYLKEVNTVMSEDIDVIQGKRTGLRPMRTWIAQCYELFYATLNVFFNIPGDQKGKTASINGSGWTVRKSLIDELGFHPLTITEDYEYDIIWTLNGKRIYYCDTALVYDRFTEDLRTSLVQRLRWTFGIVQCYRIYGKTLLKEAFRRRSASLLDLFFSTITPQIVAVFMIAVLVLVINISPSYPFIVLLAVMLLLFWIPVSVYALVTVIANGDSVRKLKKGIIFLPLFLITWLPVLVRCFFIDECRWTELRH
ncbi:MAG: glycosyltransferase family 2 protein [Erysipelotrichaceae bacterium]|nr:glycosyltransferase family 2 protein [Erysipelotrichaceae bacterium]